MNYKLRIKENFSTHNSQLTTNKGQTLIEVLASFAIAIIIVTAITIAVVSALVSAQTSKSRSLASQYAQQGMEIVRKQRDSGVAFTDNGVGTVYCLPKNASIPQSNAVSAGLCPTDSDTENGFTFRREVSFLSDTGKCPGANVHKTIVAVSWQDNKCPSSVFCNEVKLVSCLSDFSTVPTP